MCTPRSRWSGEGGEDGVGDRADAGLDRRPVGDSLGDEGGDAIVDLGPRRRGHLDERPVDLDPAEHLADVDLVAAERPRLLGVGLEEEAGAADERGGVVGVDPEAEVAVPIGPRGRGEDERVTRALAEDVAHLAEVVRHEVDRAGAKARAGDVGQEVGHVAQAVAERAVQVRPVVDGVHLVDRHAFEAVGVGLDGVEQADRLAVGQRHDDVGARGDVIENGLGVGRNRHRAHLRFRPGVGDWSKANRSRASA